MLLARGRHEEAVADFEQCLNVDPHHVSALVNRASALRELGRQEDALAGYDRALQLQASFAVAHLGRGNVLRDLRRFDEALDSYAQALRLSPGLPEVHLSRGLLLLSMRRPAEALQCFNAALTLRQDYPEAYLNRGSALLELMRPLEALESYDKALLARPAFPLGHMNRGSALLELGRSEDAIRSYDKAIALKVDYAEAYSNRGLAFVRAEQVDSAIADYNQAVEIQPNYAEAHLNRSFARLLGGDYKNGWVDYEWRRKVAQRGYCVHSEREDRDFRNPLWLGDESLTGRTILLHSEQGLGDTIQFCRYVKMVSDSGAEVILEVDNALARLLASMDGVAQLVVRGKSLPPFDYHCPLMSLPLVFKTTLSTVPAQIPYLHASSEAVVYWKKMLGDASALKIGLVWSGGLSPGHPELWSVNRRRNIPLATLARLNIPCNLEFYSLQKGQLAEAELSEAISNQWEGPKIQDFTSLLHDFADTAALIANLDLVISVDTSVAHLAGALGKPVWILNRFDTCWRWLLHRADSPWYPTAKLYRQPTAGDWDSVVHRVAADLAALARPSRESGFD